MTGYTPQNVVEPDPERLHECRHPVTSVTHRCSCPIQADHSDTEWRDRLPKETRA